MTPGKNFRLRDGEGSDRAHVVMNTHALQACKLRIGETGIEHILFRISAMDDPGEKLKSE